ASKIIYLLKNPSEASRFGENGYKMATSEFNLDKMIDNYLKFYE
ncbi:MAG: hypothetical protein UT16_C0027G0007, partial [Candidatus Azambacteria bacterium GW2011_GWA2_39_10]